MLELISSEILEQILDIVISGVVSILGSFLIALVKRGFDWLTAKAELVKSERLRQEINQANEILEQTVYDTVSSLQQTLASEIKKSILADDGKYTRQDLLNLKITAVSTVKTNLSDGVIEILGNAYSNLTDVIGEKVERAVREIKITDQRNATTVLD